MTIQAEFVEDMVLLELIVHKFNITGINNTILAQEILHHQDVRSNDNPNSIMHEDSLLDISPGSEAFKLITTINQLTASRNFVTIEQWGLIHRPLESTNTHRHDDHPLSWVYYVKIPERAGDLVFSFFDRFSVPITPKEGVLLLFPGWMHHSVSKNKSNETRISVAGNCKYFENKL
jgi:hypothetical protein